MNWDAEIIKQQTAEIAALKDRIAALDALRPDLRLYLPRAWEEGDCSQEEIEGLLSKIDAIVTGKNTPTADSPPPTAQGES